MSSIIDYLSERFREHWSEILLSVGAVLLLYALALILLHRAFAIARSRCEGKPEAERTLAFLRDLERWLSGALLIAAAAAMVLGVTWGLGIPLERFKEDALAWLRTKGLRIAIILFLAFIARRGLRFLVEQLAAVQLRRSGRSREEEVRVKTLSDVLLGGGSVIIVVIATFLVLEAVLESIGTVIASVGVVGLAFGFGAQSLVKDVIAGFFILLENQLAIGDAVRVNDVWGTVERIGLRTITLRDGEGIAHILPNGSIVRISNATKGWSRAIVHVGAEYGADPDRVLAVLRGVAREAREAPGLAGAILDEPEAVGPESFDDAVLYRISCRTVPTRQWEVMRELRYRTWKAFAREGLALKKSPQASAAGKVD